MNGYYSQSNNIYSASQPGFAPTTGANIYSQASGNIYSQNSVNIYQPPQMYAQPQTGNNNILPPINSPLYSAQLNGGYGAQAKITVNTGVPPTNVNINKTSPQVEPMAISNITEPVSTEPLISSPNPLLIKLKSCSSSEPVPEFTFGQKSCIICCGIIFLLLGLNCIIFTANLKGINIGIFLFLDILLFLYGAFVCLSVLRIRWMRYTSTLLSAILLVLGIIITIIGLVKLNKLPEDLKSHNKDYIGFLLVRLAWLL